MRVGRLVLAASLALGLCAPADEIATADLILEEDNGRLVGELKITFLRPASVFYAEKWGLDPTTGYWLNVVFRSSDRAFTLEYRGTSPKWPFAAGVRSLKAGERISMPFEVHPRADFHLRAEDGEVVALIPEGTFQVEAYFGVVENQITSRLGLTVFEAWITPIVLEVGPHSDSETTEYR